MNTPKIKKALLSFCFSLIILSSLVFISCTTSPTKARKTQLFTKNWKFHLGDVTNGQESGLDDSQWRVLNLPHDWSIEGEFSNDHPATPGGGALPGGIGWYRKIFLIPESDKNKLVFIDYDGV